MAVIGKPAPLKPWELDLIAQCRVARLATVSLGGQPHLVPVCFAFVDGAFFVPIDEKPKRATTLARVQNIERDPRATLLIDHYADDWSQLAWLRFDCGAAGRRDGASPPLSAVPGHGARGAAADRLDACTPCRVAMVGLSGLASTATVCGRFPSTCCRGRASSACPVGQGWP